MAAAPLYIAGMRRGRMRDSFDACLEKFCPDRHAFTRSLALYSAAIALSDSKSLLKTQELCLKYGVSYEQIYETMLQSYLFLGFPRMLSAAEQLADNGWLPKSEQPRVKIDAPAFAEWQKRGRALCRRVYDSNYEALKSRVEAMAPEVFLWMELEGYGKVLSRPGLNIVDREAAIVSCLIIEDRPVQLHSHLRGAMNVGAPTELIKDVVSDLAPLIAENDEITEILRRLELL